MRVTVCLDAELAPGDLRCVDADGRSILVGRTHAGELFALRNVCPHHGAPLASNHSLRPTVLPSAAGEYCRSDFEVIKCPWHGFEFDIHTGRHLFDDRSRLRVKRYEVTVDGGAIVLDVGGDAA